MDKIDRHALKALQQDGRKKNSELAKEAGLAPSTMLDRVKKLEDKGILKGYRAVVDPAKLGLKAQGFACISLDRHRVKDIELLEKEINKIPSVRACYHITGRFDYLLHVVAPDISDLGNLIKEKLATIPGMGKIETFIVYAEVKPDQGWPIDAALA
ncbi:MAG: Lrp/AsnC family transcriptional regulator [Desulfobacula sp.]|uniref:Lrp/AsnC family transcriptional regulator n=1 Tax=Desulfobacula sp. TaxID=2593537 RepID=UPI0025BB8913|nr:Lrp/AsnC family transcriptional regulator [Desulfobacula sp.]MCD4719211.1 Lrp/AsnC family transcriptional regulator [Desulfobacula sp.]MCK5163130.1 Lrp/AsnC family transcriptional regulator [Desulfobacula sp.]